MMEPIWMSVSELHAAYRSATLDPVDVVDAHLARIRRLDPVVRAFITVDELGARAAAREAARRLRDGHEPDGLFGVVVAVKDVIPVQGLRFTEGSARYHDRVATEDALLVQRLRRAGAIIIGKTNTPEFASYTNTRSEVGGTTRNPWNLTMSSGGSSGGSAVAVALGMATLAIGSDHGGSIRLPAALNGVVGIRSTPGLVPVYPSPWVQDPFDIHGPMARTIDDLDVGLAVMSGPAPQVPISGQRHRRHSYAASSLVSCLAQSTVGVSADLGGALLVDSSIRSVFETAVGSLGGVFGRVERTFPAILGVVDAIPRLRQLRGLIEHRDRMHELDRLGNPLLRQLLEDAGGQSMQAVATALTARSAATVAGERYFKTHDLFILPTTQFASFPWEQNGPTEADGIPYPDALAGILSTYLVTMLGWPAVTVPCGWATNGVPVGLQIVGPHGQEARVLCAAKALMDRFAGLRSRPPDTW